MHQLKLLQIYRDRAIKSCNQQKNANKNSNKRHSFEVTGDLVVVFGRVICLVKLTNKGCVCFALDGRWGGRGINVPNGGWGGGVLF